MARYVRDKKGRFASKGGGGGGGGGGGALGAGEAARRTDASARRTFVTEALQKKGLPTRADGQKAMVSKQLQNSRGHKNLQKRVVAKKQEVIAAKKEAMTANANVRGAKPGGERIKALRASDKAERVVKSKSSQLDKAKQRVTRSEEKTARKLDDRVRNVSNSARERFLRAKPKAAPKAKGGGGGKMSKSSTSKATQKAKAQYKEAASKNRAAQKENAATQGYKNSTDFEKKFWAQKARGAQSGLTRVTNRLSGKKAGATKTTAKKTTAPKKSTAPKKQSTRSKNIAADKKLKATGMTSSGTRTKTALSKRFSGTAKTKSSAASRWTEEAHYRSSQVSLSKANRKSTVKSLKPRGKKATPSLSSGRPTRKALKNSVLANLELN